MQDSEKVIVIAENDKVKLRRLRDSDLHQLAVYANNEKVRVNLRDGFPNPYAITDAEKFKNMVDAQNPVTFFAIEYRGAYVGNISLSVGCDVYKKSAEIGYFVGEPYWDRGIASVAVELMTKWGFEKLDVVRIHAGVFEFNISSQRVLEKCGYVKEGIFKQAIVKNGELYDEIRYAKLKC